MVAIKRNQEFLPPANRITVYPKAPAAVRPRLPRHDPSLGPAASNGQSVRATRQKIHSYTNAYNQHLQEEIPPTKPYIGLRRAYRPGYAICVIIAGVINLVSGIIMTALAYSTREDLDSDAVRVLKVLGPIVIVIGIIFLLCGLVLLFHFRKTKREEKEARERGHGFYDRPSHHNRKRPQHLMETRHDRDGQPVYTIDVASPSIPTQSQPDYSLYDELPRQSSRRHRKSRREPRGGDWKYVSDIRDMTLAPSKYPREIRKQPPTGDVTLHQYRMYPYDRSFRINNNNDNNNNIQPLNNTRPGPVRASTRLRSSGQYRQPQPEGQQLRY